jgi:hypothetical protein
VDKARGRELLRKADFRTLFIEELGWDRHDGTPEVTVQGEQIRLVAVAHKRGMVAYHCPFPSGAQLPDSVLRRKIGQQVAKVSLENFIIFTGARAPTHVWQWARREAGKPVAYREHTRYVLLAAIEKRMTAGAGPGDKKPYQVWREALATDPTAYQILTPHRGELHGVEALNEACQDRISKFIIDRIGTVDGITLSDNVIQVRNRPQSNPIWAYDGASRKKIKVEVFNGEIGTVQSFGFDNKLWTTVKIGCGPRLKRFAVRPVQAGPRYEPTGELARELRGSVLRCSARLSRACNGRPANPNFSLLSPGSSRLTRA